MGKEEGGQGGTLFCVRSSQATFGFFPIFAFFVLIEKKKSFRSSMRKITLQAQNRGKPGLGSLNDKTSHQKFHTPIYRTMAFGDR